MERPRKPLYKNELARCYNVSKNTFRLWLNSLKEEGDKILDTGAKKLLYPKDINIIVDQFGEPDWGLL